MECSMLKCYSFAMWLLISLCCSTVYAAEFDLEVNTGATYDSNVYRSAVSPEEDGYFVLAPKLALTIPRDKTYLKADLRGVLEQHVDVTDANLQELVFSGLGRYNFSDYMSFGMQNSLVVSDRLQSAEKLSDVTRYREFLDNRFLSAFKYELKENVMAASLEYANAVRNYWDTEKDDWMAHSGRLQVEYFLGHKTSTRLDIGLATKSYEADVDYVSFPVTGSLKRELSSKFEAELSLGFEGRRYNEILEERDWNKPTMRLDIVGHLTDKTSSRLVLHRRNYDSDFLTGYAFASTAADFSLILALSDRTRLTLQGLYSRNDYATLAREDDVLGGRGRIRYRLSRWGEIVLGYGHERRDSNVPNNDYTQNKVELFYAVLF